jgi:hypothetical protein
MHKHQDYNSSGLYTQRWIHHLALGANTLVLSGIEGYLLEKAYHDLSQV